MIQIQRKICIDIIQQLAISSLQFFAHATTAQIWCAVQNYVVIIA